MTVSTGRTLSKPLIAGFVLGLVFCTGIAIGLGVDWFNGDSDRPMADAATTNLAGQNFEVPSEMRELMLNASSAAGGKSMAMATGPVDDSLEAIFVLDFLTGELYCWVLGPSGGWMAQYRTNVVAEFGGTDKERAPEYVMTTGFVQLRGRSGNDPANTVCYVGDANSGKVCAFSFEWDRTSARSGREQSGLLVKIAEGVTRSASIERN